MILTTFVEPPLDNNNYLLIDEAAKEAVLFDCSCYDEKIVELLKSKGVSLKYILLTHAHFDHILGIEKMVEATGAKVVLHKDDENLLNNLNSYGFMLGLPEVNIPKVDLFVTEDEILTIGSLEIKALHTPGHTLGGVSYFVGNMLFSGDTLFQESVGRTDLEGGSFETLEESIRNKLFTLPEDVTVYPGHGPMTTVGHEKKYNSYI